MSRPTVAEVAEDPELWDEFEDRVHGMYMEYMAKLGSEAAVRNKIFSVLIAETLDAMRQRGELLAHSMGSVLVEARDTDKLH